MLNSIDWNLQILPYSKKLKKSIAFKLMSLSLKNFIFIYNDFLLLFTYRELNLYYQLYITEFDDLTILKIESCYLSELDRKFIGTDCGDLLRGREVCWSGDQYKGLNYAR